MTDDEDEVRQPTMDELRAKMCSAVGWLGKYADEPGSGPTGKTCHSCAFLRYTGNVRKYPKCGRTGYTHGDATTIKTGTAACRRFEEAAQ